MRVVLTPKSVVTTELTLIIRVILTLKVELNSTPEMGYF